MKRISDKIKCRKVGKEFEVYILRTSMDQFGKLHQKRILWDTYRTKEKCEEASIEDVQSMINCGYHVNGEYRNGIKV